ncbi:MAG TPA: nuclear transport factor 2 family protein [Acidimicrobiales bacterium]|nr:nuclear transport factor 2 family protein [Acidimicrobiales bacterium]
MTVRDDICNLLAEYNHAVDDGRVDDVLATFTADASIEFPVGTHRGTEELRAAYESWIPRAPQRHMVANTRVIDASSTSARVVSDFAFLVKGETGWTIFVVGRYDDEVVHDGTRWRFARRTSVFL